MVILRTTFSYELQPKNQETSFNNKAVKLITADKLLSVALLSTEINTVFTLEENKES